MMFSPMKAVTRHIGIPVLAAAPISPTRVKIRATSSSAELAMLSSSYSSKLMRSIIHPADVKSLTELPALGIDQQRVVEIPDDDMGGPGHRDYASEAGQKEQTAPATRTICLVRALWSTILVHFIPTAETTRAKQDRATELHIRPLAAWRSGGRNSRESYTLHCILILAFHPQTFPPSLHDNDVLFYERCYLPHRQARHSCHSNESNEADDEGHYLTTDGILTTLDNRHMSWPASHRSKSLRKIEAACCNHSLLKYSAIMRSGRCTVQFFTHILDAYKSWMASSQGTRSPLSKDDPGDQQNARSGPANKQGLSQLPFLRIHHQWAVEVPDDVVGHPANRDERAVALLGPTSCDEQGEDHQDYGHTHEPPGCLQLWGRISIHPQALPEFLHDYEIGTNEGRDPPHGQGSDSDGPTQADGAQDQGQDLQLCSHGSAE
ncbi:hypothetical protein F7725_020492, partial [Dissostichus mawsoni]